MKRLSLLLLTSLLLNGCVEFKEEKPLSPQEQAAWEAGPKYGPGCYEVINSEEKYLYGCTFYSRQGSMFLGLREYGEQKAEPKCWRLIPNEPIRCLADMRTFVKESDVKKIKCPEKFYR